MTRHFYKGHGTSMDDKEPLQDTSMKDEPALRRTTQIYEVGNKAPLERTRHLYQGQCTSMKDNAPI